MTDPDVVVTDVTKEVTCGDVRITIHIGAHGFIRISPHELPFGEIPNLLLALNTAQVLADPDGAAVSRYNEEPER